jgi:hypothetical protein
VLLSERNPEPGRINRLQTLPPGGLPKLVVLRDGARQNLAEVGRTLVLLTTQLPENPPSNSRHEPRSDEAWPDGTWIDPLYLFGCGLFWCKWRSPSAGWELIGCLRSSRQAARIAATFLVQAENVPLPAGEHLRAINGTRKPPVPAVLAASDSRRRWRL